MPTDQMAPITVSSRCLARRLTPPISTAEAKAAATAPNIGSHQRQCQTTCK